MHFYGGSQGAPILACIVVAASSCTVAVASGSRQAVAVMSWGGTAGLELCYGVRQSVPPFDWGELPAPSQFLRVVAAKAPSVYDFLSKVGRFMIFRQRWTDHFVGGLV